MIITSHLHGKKLDLFTIFVYLQSELLLNLDDHEGVVEMLSKAVTTVPSPALCERYLTIIVQVSGKEKPLIYSRIISLE